MPITFRTASIRLLTAPRTRLNTFDTVETIAPPMLEKKFFMACRPACTFSTQAFQIF